MKNQILKETIGDVLSPRQITYPLDSLTILSLSNRFDIHVLTKDNKWMYLTSICHNYKDEKKEIARAVKWFKDGEYKQYIKKIQKYRIVMCCDARVIRESRIIK